MGNTRGIVAATPGSHTRAGFYTGGPLEARKEARQQPGEHSLIDKPRGTTGSRATSLPKGCYIPATDRGVNVVACEKGVQRRGEQCRPCFSGPSTLLPSTYSGHP
ncbi:hypothetical protein MRX96_038611 [Rhipicephalus microplus]